MGAREVLAGAAAGLVVGGYMVSALSDHEQTPPPPVVKIKEIKVPYKVTETKTVRAKLPSSCTSLVDNLNLDGTIYSNATKSTGKILIALQDIGRAGVMDDIKTVNAAIEVVRTNKATLDESSVQQATFNSTLKTNLQQCKDDLDD